MTEAHKPVYSRHRFPKQIAKGTCRGCHGPVTAPRRRTWCSDECKKRYDPCFVPYEELPPEQKAKDALFIGVVHALRSMVA